MFDAARGVRKVLRVDGVQHHVVGLSNRFDDVRDCDLPTLILRGAEGEQADDVMAGAQPGHDRAKAAALVGDPIP